MLCKGLCLSGATAVWCVYLRRLDLSRGSQIHVQMDVLDVLARIHYR